MNVAGLGSLVFVFAAGAPAILVEPSSLAKLVKSADKAVVDSALTSAGLLERCQGALQKTDFNGLHCRLAVVEAVAGRPLLTTVDVETRAALAADALGAADYIAGTTPKAPEPGLRRTRFEAHKRACRIAFAALSDLEGLPAAHVAASRAKVLTAGTPRDATGTPSKTPPIVGLRDGACACGQRTVDLGVGAEVTSDEDAAARGVLSRNHCGLAGETLRIAERKDPARALQTGDESLRSVAEASSAAGRLVAMAKGRTVEFTRCTDKHIDDGKVKDKAKLSTCACGIISRWSLPLKKDDPKVQARLPILDGDKLFVPITVEGNAITACGDVEGPLLPP